MRSSRHPREVRPVRAQDPARLVDDQPEDGLGVADRRDPGRDLAQRALGLGAAGGLLARPAELADQLRVVDRDRREVGERREQVAASWSPNRPTLGREHRERAEDGGLADRAARTRSTGSRPGEGSRRWPAPSREPRVGGVVVGHDHAPLADRAGTRRRRPRLRSLRLVADRRRRCPRRGPSGPRPWPGRAGRSPRRDEPSSRAASSVTSWRSSAGSWIVIIRRAISRSARSASAVRSERRLRRGEPVDEARVRDRDRGLARERRDEPERVLAERAHGAVAGLEHAQQALLADDRRGDDRVEVDVAARPRRPRRSAGTACRAGSRREATGRPSRTARPARPVGGASGPSPDELLGHDPVVERRRLRDRSRGHDPDSGSRRSSRARSPPSRRAVSLTIRWRTSPGSVAQRAQPRRRSRAARAPPPRGGRGSRATGPAPRSAAPGRGRPPTARRSSRAARRRPGRTRPSGVDQTVIAPNGPWSPNSGVAMTPWMPLRADVGVRARARGRGCRRSGSRG